MNPALLRRRLGWRLFLSYLVIVLVGVTVLMGTAWLIAPASVSRHADAMRATVSNDPRLIADVYRAFNEGVMEVLAIAAVAAVLAALLVSVFTARRIVTPIRTMTAASQWIANGDYGQRVPVVGEDELSALAQSFNRMAEALDHTERRRLDLIGDVAHELRTPLAAIRSSMEGLIDGVLPPDPETYAGIEREASRLQRLVRDLEDLSQAEAGQTPLEIQRLPLAELLEAAAARLQGQYDDKGIALMVQRPDPDLAVNVDFHRILQVLTNLLGNALQHTPPGGRVTLAGRREAAFAVVSVVDTGAGIAPRHLPHVFERFYRVDKSRSRVAGGSGIGLTISRHLVQAHGGRIWATSDGPGRGAGFYFTLPLA